MTGNRRWSWALLPPPSYRSFLVVLFPPSLLLTRAVDPPGEREGVRTKCIANRSIRLGQKGERRSSPLLPPPLVIVQREDGGRFAESPVAPVHRRKICRSIKREKLAGFVAHRRFRLFGMGAEQVLKLHRMARMVAYVRVWWNIVLRCIVSEVLENGLSLLSRHSRHPYPSIPPPSSTLHNTPSISLTPLLSSPPSSSLSRSSPLTSSISSVMTNDAAVAVAHAPLRRPRDRPPLHCARHHETQRAP